MTNLIWNGEVLETVEDIATAAIEVATKESAARAAVFLSNYAVWIALNKPEYGMDATRIALENMESFIMQLDEPGMYHYYRTTFLPAWAVSDALGGS